MTPEQIMNDLSPSSLAAADPALSTPPPTSPPASAAAVPMVEVKCKRCGGSGEYRVAANMDGTATMGFKCGLCHGTGRLKRKARSKSASRGTLPGERSRQETDGVKCGPESEHGGPRTPSTTAPGNVAQSVERRPEEPEVAGSTPVVAATDPTPAPEAAPNPPRVESASAGGREPQHICAFCYEPWGETHNCTTRLMDKWDDALRCFLCEVGEAVEKTLEKMRRKP